MLADRFPYVDPANHDRMRRQIRQNFRVVVHGERGFADLLDQVFVLLAVDLEIPEEAIQKYLVCVGFDAEQRGMNIEEVAPYQP